ncbi:MAG: 50S ribosomal protein L32 [Planctomycetes bacterium]|nr:50S ribosomal protein L32 [Planctomycetota bacterium]
MAVPKRRVSKARKRIRRSHHAMSAAQLTKCPRCSSTKLPHTICEVCGTYRDRALIPVEED